ncbi:MAG: hypothetical protein IKP73_14975 [Bacteroidales bacterium]|nr:hypothetical protein [Bacteroidales bacterium]
MNFRILKNSLLIFALLFTVASCSKDDDENDNKKNNESDLPLAEQMNSPVSGSTITNTGKIVIGLNESDFIYQRNANVLKAMGWVSKRVTDCAAMNDIPYFAGQNEVDTTKSIDNVTLVNKGTIEIHTKRIVELYESQTVNPEIEDETGRPIEYVRMFGMCSTGKNCTIINEGTIEVYFDHDPDTPIWVYCFAMAGGAGSQIINKGTIKFSGNGSRRTRMRCIAITGAGATAINEGDMFMNVDMAEDCRMITCGENRCTIINDGMMKGRVPGTLFGMTHYGTNTVLNRGNINLTVVPVPEGQTSILTNDMKFVCGLYNVYNQNRKVIPPMVNEGVIDIAIEGNATSDAAFQGYGFLYDLIGGNRITAGMTNDGIISVSQTGPVHFDMGEVGFKCTPKVLSVEPPLMCKVKLGHWKTRIRDFAATKDLFVAKGVGLDFTESYIDLVKTESYVIGTQYSVAEDALIYNADKRFTNEIIGFDNLVFRASGEGVKLNWDKDKQTVSLLNAK